MFFIIISNWWICKYRQIGRYLGKLNKISNLNKNNYNHYEISNYAKDGYESKHNINYWLNGDYYGFGLGAVSYLDNYRISNTKNMSKYLEFKYVDNQDYEDIKIRKENDLILGFRLINGINYKLFNYNCCLILLSFE